MAQSEQERFDRRKRLDYLDVSEGTVGIDVRVSNSSSLAQPDCEAMSNHLQGFLKRAGVRNEKAIPVGIGTTSGGPGTGTVEAVFQFMKPIGITIQVAKFLLAWHARVAARKRRELLPRVNVTLLADHMEPRRAGPHKWEDMARLLVLILPDLQADLESEFPSCSILYEFRAVGQKIARVTVRAGEGLRVTDNHVLKMLKHLDSDKPSLTIFHREGWFALPKVVSVDFVVRPLRIPDYVPPFPHGKG